MTHLSFYYTYLRTYRTEHRMISRALVLALAACAGVAQAQLGSSWPAEPVPAEGLRAAASRQLAEAASGDIANYHAILWSSLGLVVVTIYCVMALFNMDISQDSLLYSKSKSD